MLKAKYTWNIQHPGIVSDRDIYSVILKNRGIDDPDHFFSMGKEVLKDPFLLHDMDKAVNRLRLAIQNQEHILIFGDYDADGITAISVLYRTLRSLGANVTYDLPDRFVDGYGLNMNAVEKIIQGDVKVVVTVDNGITCIDEVDVLIRHGIDTIITDHHQQKESLPQAFAIVHPKLSPEYPFKEIAGVMVSYKLSCALKGEFLDDVTDLVMIGTIADLMPLEDENQAMVNLGLLRLQETTNLGLAKIVEYSHLDLINETAIAFKIAPKINSSGRMGKALEAVKLLTTTSEREANDLILLIEEYHANRKDLTEEAFQLCEKLLSAEDDVIVVASPFLHEGVIGICAQKIAEKYQKTTCIITLDEDGIGKGSMRSFGGDNILTMLEANKHLLMKFGGHSQAAGLQLSKDNIEALRQGFAACSKSSEALTLNVDMEVDLPKVRIDTIKKLQDKSFFTATFAFRNLTVIKKVKMSEKHTKLSLEKDGQFYDALSFNNLEYFHSLEEGDIIDCVGGLNINEWRHRLTIQIMIRDLRCNDFQVLDLRNKDIYQNAIGWIRTVTTLVSDENLMDGSLLKTLREQRPKTILLVPERHLTMIRDVVDKETYIRIYKSFPQGPFTLSEVEKKTKDSIWVLKKVIDVFMELGLLSKTVEGWTKETPENKKELFTSPLFQSLRELNKMANWLYQETQLNIKNTLFSWMED